MQHITTIVRTNNSITITDKYKQPKRAILGYAKRNGKLMKHRKYGAIVEAIFGYRANGYSYGMITELINDTGAKTPRGKKFSKATVRSILHNPRYMGDEDTTPLVSKAVFDKVQNMGC